MLAVFGSVRVAQSPVGCLYSWPRAGRDQRKLGDPRVLLRHSFSSMGEQRIFRGADRGAALCFWRLLIWKTVNRTEKLFYYFIYGMNNCLMVTCELHKQFSSLKIRCCYHTLFSYSVFSHCSFVLKACMYPATLMVSVRLNLKTSNGSKICQVTLRNLPWDEWVGKISLICSWEEIPLRYNFIFCKWSAWDCGCLVPQRQVKKTSKPVQGSRVGASSSAVRLASVIKSSPSASDFSPPRAIALSMLARFQQALLYQIRYLLQWTSAVGPRGASVKKTAFKVQRAGLGEGFFVCFMPPVRIKWREALWYCAGIVENILNFSCFSKYQSREVWVMLCFLLSINISSGALCVVVMKMLRECACVCFPCLFAGVCWALVLGKIARGSGLRGLGSLLKILGSNHARTVYRGSGYVGSVI